MMVLAHKWLVYVLLFYRTGRRVMADWQKRMFGTCVKNTDNLPRLRSSVFYHTHLEVKENEQEKSNSVD